MMHSLPFDLGKMKQKTKNKKRAPPLVQSANLLTNEAVAASLNHKLDDLHPHFTHQIDHTNSPQ